MADCCILCYITDRSAFPGDERARRQQVLDKIAEAASCGVDYVELREKDLSARELQSLASEASRVIREQFKASARDQRRTVLLINSRIDVALAASADGVHLRSEDVSPEDVRVAWRHSGERGGIPSEISPPSPVIGISCHSPQEVAQAAAQGATFAVFAPVFEKSGGAKSKPAGIDALRQACLAQIPVLALGGVTLENAACCLHAGAAGIAAIRLFQQSEIATVVRALRG